MGRIVCTNSKSLSGVGLKPKKDSKDPFRNPGFLDVKGMMSGTVEKSFLDTEGAKQTVTYVAPFSRCDREADMRQAYSVFKRRFS
jgi:hypothetical protein